MKRLFLLFALVGMSLNAQETKDPVLMKIGDKSITKSEFEYVYNKNAKQQMEKMDLSEYMKLYTQFRLKVAEAEAQGIDKDRKFKIELLGYRKQLAEPYLTDNNINEELVREAYRHMLVNREVSHILIRTQPESTPEDTLRAYNQAMEIYNQLQGGGDFTSLAKKYSQDQSVEHNGGYMGFIRSFTTVYPFEKAAYDTPVGGISKPVRTVYGYHIVKVHGERIDPGKAKVAHISIEIFDPKSPKSVATAKNEMKKIQAELNKGKDFKEVTKKYSGNSAQFISGGELPFFVTGQVTKIIEDQAFSLKNIGDISPVLEDENALHIIKLIDRRPVETYEEAYMEILRRISKDQRGQAGRFSFVEKLKKEYNFTTNSNAYQELSNFARLVAPWDTAFQNPVKKDFSHLMTINGKRYPCAQFGMFLETFCGHGDESEQEYLDKNYDYWVNYEILNYENTRLEEKYPEFRSLMQEYRDGMLLFEISNREVWEKAAADEKGLTKFFKKNKKRYAFNSPRYKGFVFQCKNEEVAKAALKRAAKLPADSVVTVLNREFNTDSIPTIKIERGLFAQGANKWVDQKYFKQEVTETDPLYPVVAFKGSLLKKYPEAFSDVRGQVISDYQNEVEKQWLKQLAKKYRVEIDQEVLKTIKPYTK